MYVYSIYMYLYLYSVFNIYIYVYSIHYTLREKANVKKFPLDKINVFLLSKVFFLSRTPAHHSFAFNSQFLHEQSVTFVMDFSFLVPLRFY